MVVLLVLFTSTVFLSIDSFRNWNKNRIRVPRGTMYTTPGFEVLGCLAQDGPLPEKKKSHKQNPKA